MKKIKIVFWTKCPGGGGGGHREPILRENPEIEILATLGAGNFFWAPKSKNRQPAYFLESYFTYVQQF